MVIILRYSFFNFTPQLFRCSSPFWIVPNVHCTAVTDDSHKKDVLQLTTAIGMANPVPKKKMYDSKILKTIRM